MTTRLTTALLVLALLAAGCAPAEPTAGAATDAQRPLRIVNSYTVDSLDPAEAGVQWLFDFGAAENPMLRTEDGTLEPWLLEELVPVDDRTWRLVLRPGVTFHNGRELDAAALAASLSRQLERSTNAQAQLAGATAEATGPREVTLTTPGPNATVPAALAERGAFPVYDVDAVEAAAGDPQALARAGFYTGPYRVTTYTDQRLVLARFDDHWQGTPPLPGVEVRVVPDEQARLLAVQNGEADLALYPPLEARQVLEGRDDAVFAASELALQSLMMPLNTQRPPFDDTRVRRAYSLGIDYQQLGEEVTGGVFEVARGLYPSSEPYALDNQRTDPAAARRLLDEAGWRPGADGVRVKDGERLEVTLLPTPEGPETRTLAVALRSQLAEIGFDVRISDFEDQVAAMEDPDAWDAALQLSGTLSGTGDPVEPFGRTFASDGDRNRGGIEDPELDRIADELLTAFEPADRDALLRRAQQIVVEEQAYTVAAAFKRFLVVAGRDYAGYEVSSYRRHVTSETRPG